MASVAQRGVAAPPVVEDCDVLEQVGLGRRPGRVASAVHTLVLQAVEEAFGWRVDAPMSSGAGGVRQVGEDRLALLPSTCNATHVPVCCMRTHMRDQAPDGFSVSAVRVWLRSTSLNSEAARGRAVVSVGEIRVQSFAGSAACTGGGADSALANTSGRFWLAAWEDTSPPTHGRSTR